MTFQTIGRYQVVSRLGLGGMATVYHAHDPRFERDVAIKVMPREFLHDPTFRARFDREAKAIARLEHSAIVPVHDFGEQGGQPYLVMRYMSGGTLADRIKKEPLALAEVVRILERIGAALDSAHNKGIIHRDVKPSNILFDQYDDAFLSDFGIVKVSEATAQLTGSGIVGTPAYMAPEMASAEGLSYLIDVYALGVTLFEMLTGKLPYDSPTPMGTMMAHVTKPIPDARRERPDLPGGVQTVINRAMAKDPLDRYQSAGELAGGLRAVMATRPAPQPANVYEPTLKVHAPPEPVHLQTVRQGEVAEPGSVSTPAVAAPEARPVEARRLHIWWLCIPLMAVVWAVAWVIALNVGIAVSRDVYYAVRDMGFYDAGWGVAWAVGWVVGGPVGALLSSLVLKLAAPSFTWRQMLVLLFGWAVCMPAFGPIGAGSVVSGIGPAVVGAVGGYFTGMAVKWAVPTTRWGQVFTVAFFWLVGFGVAGGIASSIGHDTCSSCWSSGGALGGAVAGFLGGLFTFIGLGRARHRALLAE